MLRTVQCVRNKWGPHKYTGLRRRNVVYECFTFLGPVIKRQTANGIIPLPFQINIYRQCRKSGDSAQSVQGLGYRLDNPRFQ